MTAPIHAAVIGLLQASTALVELVSTRIYPDVMPDNPTYPSLTYQKMGGSSEKGAITDPPLKSAVFQVSVWSKSRLEAANIAKLVIDAMDRQRKQTVAGVAIDDSFYEDDLDLYDAPTRTYFNHSSFKIFYRDV